MCGISNRCRRCLFRRLSGAQHTWRQASEAKRRDASRTQQVQETVFLSLWHKSNEIPQASSVVMCLSRVPRSCCSGSFRAKWLTWSSQIYCIFMLLWVDPLTIHRKLPTRHLLHPLFMMVIILCF